MQNILLLNSENSIPDRTPAEFQTVWLQLPQSPRRSPREKCGAGAGLGGEGRTGRGQGAQILYNYRKGAIRVAGETRTKNWSDALSSEFLNFCIGSYPGTQQLWDASVLFWF